MTLPAARKRVSRHKAEETMPDRISQGVKLPPDLHRRLRVCAALEGKQISQVVEEALRKHLDEVDRMRRARGAAPIPKE